jgi:polysaccharide biosynthesis/export protein
MHDLRSAILLAILVRAVGPAVAAQGNSIVDTSLSLSAPAPSPRTADDPALSRRDARYRLCTSDVIALTFPLTPEFDETVNIQPDGFASLVGASDVRLEGLTTQESVEAIRTAYAKVLHDPIVTIELKDFNKPYFIVTGQVNRPGKFDLRGDTSATQAVAIAGGFTDSSLHSQVLLFRRANNDWYEVKTLNLKRILHGQQINEDPEIQPGDMLFVPTISHLQERDPKSIPAVYRQSYRLVFFLAVPAFACLTVASPFISRIWIGRNESVFVEFVAILSAGWLVNVLSNPAYVVDLGTGVLRWVSVGCIVTAILNAVLGFFAGRYGASMPAGGQAVVIASAFSLALGYVVVLVSYHLENRVPFSQLLPRESGGILFISLAGILILFPLLARTAAHSLSSQRATGGAAATLIATIAISMWCHPMRKQLFRWVFPRVPA